MKMTCGFSSPPFAALLFFSLLLQSGVAIAAGDHSQDKAASTEEMPTVPALEEGTTPPSPAAGETPQPPVAPASPPAAGQGAARAAEAAVRAAGTSAGPSAPPSAVPRAREENAGPPESIEKPGDAYPVERGHLGLVLGTVKGFGLGGPKFAYGLRGGFTIRPIEIGFLVGGSGQFSDEYGALTVYPILFRLNVVIDVNSIFSLFVGGQVGLVHYRRKLSVGVTRGIYASDYDYFDQTVSTNLFAYGLQGGGAVLLTSLWSLRFELAWLHVGETSAEVSNYYAWGRSFFGFTTPAKDFLHASGAVCITF